MRVDLAYLRVDRGDRAVVDVERFDATGEVFKVGREGLVFGRTLRDRQTTLAGERAQIWCIFGVEH